MSLKQSIVGSCLVRGDIRIAEGTDAPFQTQEASVRASSAARPGAIIVKIGCRTYSMPKETALELATALSNAGNSQYAKPEQQPKKFEVVDGGGKVLATVEALQKSDITVRLA
jgi:hypothetical protein